MGLPEGLQVYAENIFRRFPEEFIALGCPRLEEDFSLQTSTRRITDMGSSKSLEIVLRKGPMSPSSRLDELKPAVPNAQGAAALASQVTALHARLAMLERKDEPQDRGARGSAGADPLPRPQSGGERTPHSALAHRRGKEVHVDVPNKPPSHREAPVLEAARAGGGSPAAGREPAAAPEKAPEKREDVKGAGTTQPKSQLNGRDQAESDKRGDLSIRATRVMPTSDEPESPRSPGWFSAWGK
jgi:hypothetical protein